MDPVDTQIRSRLGQLLESISARLGADVVAISGSIMPGLEVELRKAVDAIDQKRHSVAVILDTLGGVVEVVELMATVLRHAYGHKRSEVIMIVPGKAMSAGTIFALSADKIMMDHLSCLGPIDPQVVKNGKLVPALSYLNQFERLNAKSGKNKLTTAEFALVQKFDVGELYRFERARELSIDLLKKWLSTYKFKNWKKNGKAVTKKNKEKRAEEIATLLNDPEEWHSHNRAINRETIRAKVGLKIDELEEDEELFRDVTEYFQLLTDYMYKSDLDSVVQSKEYFS